MLFMSFNEAEITEQSTNIQNSVHQYNRKFSSEPRTVSLPCHSCYNVLSSSYVSTPKFISSKLQIVKQVHYFSLRSI